MELLKIDLTKFLDNKAIVYYEDEEKSNIVKYKDLLKQVLKISLVLEQESLSRNEAISIGIFCTKSPATIALSLAIIESGFGFCNLTRDDIDNDLDNLGCKYFFSDSHFTSNYGIRGSFELFGKNFRLYRSSSFAPVKIFDDFGDDLNRICYTVTTSGSTGKRKIVHVPFKCILPNVDSLQQIFRLENDVILASAPCTFDVFILDMILALHSGSQILILNENLRYSRKAIELLCNSVTFLQITPSLFKNYGIDIIKNKILHPNSNLKYLVLGGEKFPSTNEVEEWQNWNSKTRKRIFNIYGITEMSCWAMIHEVTKDDINDGKVPLGNLLSQTNFGFLCDSADAFHQGEEHMVLFSTKRYCYVDDRKIENHMEEQDLSIAYYTGDIVKRINGKIYYCGRRDGMIKRLGSRVSLCKIETVASSVLPEVSCIYTKKQLVLFCQTENDAEIADLKTYLRNNLSSSEIPDEILKISFFPLSKHGKVDKHQLKLIFKDLLHDDRKKRAQIEDTFLEAINQMFNLRLGKILNRENSDEPDGKRMKTEIDLTFRALGGSSFDALRISMKLDDIFGVQNIVLPKLLSDHESIRDICSYLKKLEIKNTSKIDNNYLNPGKLSTKVLQTFDMKKCIDATPNVTKDGKFLSVGSHSHEILTIDLEQLQIISRTVLGDRIESEVTFKGYFGFVGCYDGFLYCFNLISGEIQWKFDTQGKIKSKAIICEDFIIIGNYNENSNLLCIGLNGELRWKRLIGSRGILANPLIINDSSILVCSLDGIVEMMDFHGNSQWTKKYEFPIFSSPQIVPGANAILLAEVSRNVHCIDFQGNDLWKYETEGEIFSTFSFQKLNSFETGIIFGCHDKKLRYIKFNNKINSVELKWTCELNSQLFSTPKFTDRNMIVSCSTDGHINFIDSLTGTVQHCHKLPGEIFSTPLIIGQRIFVGCRNNYLYCIEF